MRIITLSLVDLANIKRLAITLGKSQTKKNSLLTILIRCFSWGYTIAPISPVGHLISSLVTGPTLCKPLISFRQVEWLPSGRAGFTEFYFDRHSALWKSVLRSTFPVNFPVNTTKIDHALAVLKPTTIKAEERLKNEKCSGSLSELLRILRIKLQVALWQQRWKPIVSKPYRQQFRLEHFCTPLDLPRPDTCPSTSHTSCSCWTYLPRCKTQLLELSLSHKAL